MSRAWMPLYVADYLADTGHLSAAEHGAYLLLIMHYWQNGGLPNEDRRLARICRMSPDEWADARETLFDMFDDGWKHARIEEELQAARDISDKAKEKAAKRWNKPGIADADAAAMPVHMPQVCQSQSQPPLSTVSNEPVERRAKAQPEHAQILEALTGVLSEDRARAVIEHRKKKKSPLNVHIAQLLARQFSQLAEPDKAADLMMMRGWQGCEIEWCVNAGLQLASSPSLATSGDGGRVFVKQDSDAWWAWRDYRKAMGKPTATAITSKEHKADGWWFESEFPPVAVDDPATQYDQHKGRNAA